MMVYLYYRVVVTCYTVQGLQVSYDPFGLVIFESLYDFISPECYELE
jgi:hypothetical protein